MKKWMVTLLGICWVTLFGFSAAEAQEIADNVLAVESGEISSEMELYAKNNVSNKIVSMLLPEGKGQADLEDYTLGSGISMLNTYEKIEERTAVYPIYYDGKIVYTYMVKKDEEQYIDTIGVSLVKELNELAVQEKGSQTPITLFNKGYDIYYTNGNEENVLLYQAPIQSDLQNETTVEEVVDAISNEHTETVDMSEENEYIKPKKMVRGYSSGSNYSMIDLKIYENQLQVNGGKNEWCMGYALSAIANTKRSSFYLKAETVMRHFFPKATGQSFYMNGGINMQQAMDYSKSKLGMNPYYVNRPLTLAENRNELNKGNPVFVFAKVEYDSNAKYAYHALVLHGWVNPDKGLNVYYIWNPWYPHTNCIDGGVKSPTLPFPGGKFTWEHSLRNFQ